MSDLKIKLFADGVFDDGAEKIQILKYVADPLIKGFTDESHADAGVKGVLRGPVSALRI
jgi:hypothetical protein